MCVRAHFLYLKRIFLSHGNKHTCDVAGFRGGRCVCFWVPLTGAAVIFMVLVLSGRALTALDRRSAGVKAGPLVKADAHATRAKRATRTAVRILKMVFGGREKGAEVAGRYRGEDPEN